MMKQIKGGRLMKKHIFALTTAFLLIAVSFLVPQKAEAVPAFARQTGFACNTCHFQHFPLLNQFGRAFKAGGYTMTGGDQGLVEGDFLSIPTVLNATLITRTIYTKTNGDNDDSGTNKGNLVLPNDAALFLAGRVGERIGFTLEAQLTDKDEAMFDSFKVPITVHQLEDGTNLQVIPYTTGSAGAAFGFELLNTGAMMMMRPMQNMMAASAQMFIMTAGTGKAATGVAFVVNNSKWFANYSSWTPEQSGADAGPYLHYLRAAITPQYNGWDLGAGFQWWGGNGKRGTTREKVEAWGLDFQAQGSVGDNMPLGVYFTYATAAKSVAGETANIYNSGTNDDKVAWSILAELGVIPGRATVIASYLDGDNGAATLNEDTALTLGGTYLVAQNFELQLNHTFYGGNKYDSSPANGDQKTILMVFAAF
jgi:hypothetical protein